MLAIIFGIIALVQIPQRRQKGRGLAIGGIAATGGWVVLALSLIVIAGIGITDGSGDDDPAGAERQGSPVSWPDLEVGQCVESLPVGGEVTDVLIVDCDLPHKAEVYATFDLTDRAWPGDDAVDKEAYEGCRERLLNHPNAPADPSVLLGHLYPTEGLWAIGDRRGVAWPTSSATPAPGRCSTDRAGVGVPC